MGCLLGNRAGELDRERLFVSHCSAWRGMCTCIIFCSRWIARHESRVQAGHVSKVENSATFFTHRTSHTTELDF